MALAECAQLLYHYLLFVISFISWCCQQSRLYSYLWQDDWWILDWKGYGKKQLQPHLFYYSDTWMEYWRYGNKKKIPCEWSEGILCPINKKGDRKQYNNYRGISLVNITYKIFAILLYNCLSKIVEPAIGNYQTGFRTNRSTTYIYCETDIWEMLWI